MERLSIVFVAGEAVPFCKTGGLADVAGTLPIVLKNEGIDVSVFLPFYRIVKNKKDFSFEKTLSIEVKGIKGEVLKTKNKGVDFYFIKQDSLYDREELYATPKGEYEDNARRFSFFNFAALYALEKLNIKTDIIHIHDWHTGLIPLLIKESLVSDYFNNTKTLITIHNLAYQGWFGFEKKEQLLFLEDFDFSKLLYKEQFNFLYLGLKYSDYISTVSSTYSQEIMTEEFGCGLDWLLKERKNVLKGILNGIDYEEWNPEKDEYLPYKFSIEDLSGKEECKKSLLEEHNLPYLKDKLLIGAVGRLTDQKGWDIIAEAIEEILKLDIYFILLGTGEEKYHKLFTNIGEKFKERAGINIKFDNALAHRIYGGSDFFLMPSYFEPCGLGQLISFKYGTVPIVTPVGGLKDTVKDEYGIVLSDYSSKSLIEAIKKAKEIFSNREKFEELRKKIMELDFSWGNQAKEYKEFYLQILEG